MSEVEKDNREYEFIREQVIQKKRKKFKKWLYPFLMTIFMAILFGVIAAITFCITEPRFYNFLHKNEDVKTPISFPTTYPDPSEEEVTQIPDSNDPDRDENPSEGQAGVDKTEEPDQVIIETVEADIDDFVGMYDDIRTVAYHTNKSLVTVSSIIAGKDWFGNPMEKKNNTTGVIIANDGVELFVLVSLDRVKDASSIKLELTESTTINAVLQDYESELNLAVISVKLEDIPPLFLNNNITVAKLGESYTITVGSPVMALGNPNGYTDSMDLGIITSKGSSISITDNKLDLFNTNIKFNSESDGIIVNLKGEVIGLITRTLKKDLNEDLSTVIGISKVKSIIEKLAKNEPRIYCGIMAEDMTEAAKTEHDVSNGIYVNEVLGNSPAFEAGMKGGDIIVTVDEKSIINTNSFYNIISGYKPGEEISFKIKRTSGTTDKDMDLKVVFTEKER